MAMVGAMSAPKMQNIFKWHSPLGYRGVDWPKTVPAVVHNALKKSFVHYLSLVSVLTSERENFKHVNFEIEQ